MTVKVPVTVVNKVERCFGSGIPCGDVEIDTLKFKGDDGMVRSMRLLVLCPHMDVCRYYGKEYGDDR